MIAELVYFSCAALSVTCAALLYRDFYLSRKRLLFWSSACFAFLALNNIFIFFDLVIFSELDLHGSLWRNTLGSAAGVTMLFGLIWELN